jgi:hypothetical protein
MLAKPDSMRGDLFAVTSYSVDHVAGSQNYNSRLAVRDIYLVNFKAEGCYFHSDVTELS